MELKITFFKRNLSFIADDKKGDSLDELILLSADLQADSIILSGESQSYTFLRQIALYCNLMHVLCGSEVVLKSKNFTKTGKLIAPIYK